MLLSKAVQSLGRIVLAGEQASNTRLVAAAPAIWKNDKRAYRERAVNHYNNPRSVGSFHKNDPNVDTGLVAAPACGGSSGFKTFGCGSAITFSSVGDKGGNASSPDPSQIDWKEWVASKLPGTGSAGSGASYGFGPRASPSESQSSFESADDFERRMFGDFSANDSRTDSFFQKLDRIEKARGKAGSGFGKDDWNEKLGWEGDQAGHGADTLADGMDDKLKKAAFEYDYGVLGPDEDYSFRPDANFPPGSTYTLKDLDLTKPAVRRPFKRPEFQTTTNEVLRKADFRNVRFLQNFITEAGILYPRKKFGIRAKAQRKIAREIKTARAFGLMPFTSMGKKAFVFGRTMEDLDEDYDFDDYDGRSDDNEDIPVEEEILETENLDIPDFELDDLKSK